MLTIFTGWTQEVDPDRQSEDDDVEGVQVGHPLGRHHPTPGQGQGHAQDLDRVRGTVVGAVKGGGKEDIIHEDPCRSIEDGENMSLGKKDANQNKL